jgi:hypothetical protein
VKNRDVVSVFYMQILVFPATFVEEVIFSPPYILGSFVKLT